MPLHHVHIGRFQPGVGQRRPDDALLRGSGLGHFTQDWLGSPATALPALLCTFAWAMFGINTVIFISGLATIPPELFDAARVDGAGTFRVLLHVVLPKAEEAKPRKIAVKAE